MPPSPLTGQIHTGSFAKTRQRRQPLPTQILFEEIYRTPGQLKRSISVFNDFKPHVVQYSNSEHQNKAYYWKKPSTGINNHVSHNRSIRHGMPRLISKHSVHLRFPVVVLQSYVPVRGQKHTRTNRSIRTALNHSEVAKDSWGHRQRRARQGRPASITPFGMNTR